MAVSVGHEPMAAHDSSTPIFIEGCTTDRKIH